MGVGGTNASKRVSTMNRLVSMRLLLFGMTVATLMVIYLITYNLMLAQSAAFHMDRSWYVYQDIEQCPLPRSTVDAMNKLTHDADQALTRLGLSPFACYGTLLGALRAFSVLAWDNNVDLCIVGEIPLDFESIEAQFDAFDIKIKEYDPWKGHYTFIRHGILGYITVFSECSSLAQFILRKDIEEIRKSREFLEPIQVRITNRSSRQYESLIAPKQTIKRNIPDWLCPAGRIAASAQKLIDVREKPIPGKFLTPPFLKQPLGKYWISIPYGDYILLKYLYPESYWFEVKPPNCRN